MPFQGPKGIKKRRDHLFQSGHAVRRAGTGPSTANTQHQQEREVKSAAGVASPSFEAVLEALDDRMLRSRTPGRTEIENKMRLVDQEKANDLWNQAIRDHARVTKRCRKPQFKQVQEQKWGLAISQGLKCMNCSFSTPVKKLFDEVRLSPGKGRKAAVPNVALAAALLHTTIGVEKARDIFSAIDLPVPQPSALQKLAVRVSKVTKKLADRGCAEKLDLVSGESKTVKIKADMRYNTARLATSRRTGLNQTSQGVTLVMEDNSGQSYIVESDIQTKICVKGTQMRLKGMNVQCPGHEGCTATTSRFDGLSEKVAGANIGKRIADRGITVTHITTDGDAQCAKGVQEVTPTPIVKLIDTTHFAQRQQIKGQGQDWSLDMFSMASTRAQKNQCAKLLAQDMKRRSVTVLHALHEKHQGKLEDIQREAELSVDAMITCYMGDCTHCTGKITTACLGGTGKDSWTMRSSLLQEEKIDNLQMTNTDVLYMDCVLKYLLGQDALEKTQLLTTTQANEAVHRLLSSKLPKNIKYSQTLEGRVGCTKEHWNHGEGKAAFRQKNELGLPTTKGQLRHMRARQQRFFWKRSYNKSPSTQQRRRKGDYLLRRQKKDWKETTASDYNKHQLEGIPEHNYSKVGAFSTTHTTYSSKS